MNLIKVKMSVAAGLVLLLSVGCVATQKNGVAKKIQYFETSGENELSGEIATIESSVSYDSRDDAEKVLRLAVLKSIGENRNPDFEKALEVIKRYVSVVPENERQAFVGYIQYLLDVIVKEKQLARKKTAALKNEKKRSRKLVKQNNALEGKIVDLKNLEIRLEKQRLGAE